MKERIKGAFTKKKILHVLKIALFVVALSLILLSLLGTVAHATGLVDDTINAENLYSKYPLSNYQLDFYVDNSWSWLPWNWLDGIGKSVQYGLYCITNFVWTISLYLSNATGYVVQEAYKLDFINDMADSIGKSIQTLAGVTENGFSSTGFYVGFLLLIILVVGIYVACTGLIKRETSKALHAVINFVVVFVLSASFIAYAPDYIKKINEFSSDISTASLDLGTKIMLTIFVFLLTGMMLFSQILFIIFAMFLPISFLLSMIPSYESMAKQAIVWHIEQSGTDTFSATYEVDQQIKEGEQTNNVKATYTVKVHVDADGDIVIIQNPTLAPSIEKSDYEPKTPEADASVDADTVNDATAFLETFFKLYPTATDKELAYYVEENALEPINGDYLFSELVNPVFTADGENVKVSVAVKFIDNQTKATQVSQYELTLHKDSNWKIIG